MHRDGVCVPAYVGAVVPSGSLNSRGPKPQESQWFRPLQATGTPRQQHFRHDEAMQAAQPHRLLHLPHHVRHLRHVRVGHRLGRVVQLRLRIVVLIVELRQRLIVLRRRRLKKRRPPPRPSGGLPGGLPDAAAGDAATTEYAPHQHERAVNESAVVHLRRRCASPSRSTSAATCVSSRSALPPSETTWTRPDTNSRTVQPGRSTWASTVRSVRSLRASATT